MNAVTQFEVYVLEKGRWFLHAKYSAEEKRRAVWDARATEKMTGFPAKVVRETIFTEQNESERVTTYISPRARRRLDAAKAPMTVSRFEEPAAVRRRTATRSLTPSQMALRVLVAAGFSLIAASLSLGVIYLLIQRLTAAGVDLPTTNISQVLMFGYVGLFFFFFFSMFRSRLALHRLLSDLWHAKPAASPRASTASSTAVAAQPMALKPKNSAAAAAVKLKEWEELRVLRGDPDVLTAEREAEPEPLPQPPPQQPPAYAAEPKQDAKAKVKAEQKTAPPVAVPVAAAPPAVDETAAMTVQLKRFVTGVVVPAAAQSMPDDPVARRGIALLISGAVDTLAKEDDAPLPNFDALLAWVLKGAGLAPAAVDLFVMQKTMQQELPPNQPLVAAGRAAMGDFLGGAEVLSTVAMALAAWRTPFGLPGPLFAPASPETPSDTAPVRDIFLLTEMRPSPIAAGDLGVMFADGTDEERISEHNARVRAALEGFGGREIKHTGKGIFAQFSVVAPAIACAQALQTEFGTSSACALIASTELYDDPAVSSTLFLRAEAAVAAVEDGGLNIESRLVSEFFTSNQSKHEGVPPEAPFSPESSPTSN